MTKLNDKNLNEIFKDILHIGRDVNDIYPKEKLYDGIGNYTNISMDKRENLHISFNRGNLTSPVISNKIFLGYNAGTIEFPELSGNQNQSYEKSIFFNIDKYSSLKIKLSDSDSLNDSTLTLYLISDYINISPNGYYYPYGFFDRSKNPKVLLTSKEFSNYGNFPLDKSKYETAIIIPNDIKDTGLFSENFPDPNWSLAARSNSYEKIDSRITNKSFYIIIENSSSMNIDNENLIKISKSNPTLDSIEGSIDSIIDITLLPMAPCSNLPPGQEVDCSHDDLSWKINANSTAIYEIYIPEPTFYVLPSSYSLPWGSFSASDEINYGIDLDYFPAVSNRAWYKKII